MFNLFKSNKMENLMAALAAVYDQDPGDPMKSEWVGVQSRGMKQWISARLADYFGISANIRFLFPKQIVTRILTASGSPDYNGSGFDTAAMFWKILDHLSADTADIKVRPPAYPDPVKAYLENDVTGKKAYQLARRITALFDDYLVYRPDMLLDWQKQSGRVRSADPHVQWQASLWQHVIAGQEEEHPAWQADRFLTRAASGGTIVPDLPPRLVFFGISAMPPLFLRIFERIAESADIHLFLLCPSHLFFFDTPTKRQAMRAAARHPEMPDAPLPEEETHPLLASLGKSGQDFFSQIEQFHYNEPGPDLFEDPAGDNSTMLSVLQSDIMNLVHRHPAGDHLPVAVSPGDRSITIHSCHSPMREAQVLKDLLIDAFDRDPDLFPHDVIVMMPDIETYAPFIESVFTTEHRLPYSVSDRLKRSESVFLETFMMILSLKGSRLEQKQVLEIMLQPPVAKKLGLTPAQMQQLEVVVRDANVLWGRDGTHRQDFNVPPYEQNTWRFGLDRLFMGMAMPDHQQNPVHGVLGCASFEGPELELLGKLALFCDGLFRCLERLAPLRTVGQWCRVLGTVAQTLLSADPDTREDELFLYRTLDALQTQADAAGFKEPLSFEVIRSLVTDQLDTAVSQGSFLAGRITFCNIMPMRSIPYKIVVLMGMAEAAFPRKVFSTGFNLLKKYPRQGDKNERLEDRYLFLETLLSARRNVIITYTGQDIQDNSPIPCAGPVSELMDVLTESFSFRDEEPFHIVHPLHPFDLRYFEKKSMVFSYSEDHCRIARSMRSRIPEMPAFLSEDDIPRKTDLPDPVDMDEFIRFFKHPVAWTLRERMNILLPVVASEIVQREPFSLAGLDRHTLGTRLVDTASEQPDPSDGYPFFKAMGSLPPGRKGKHEYDKLLGQAQPVMDAADKRGVSPALPPVATLLDTAGLKLNVRLSGIRENGITRASFGRLTAKRLLTGWIHHLCLTLCAPAHYPKTTRLIGQAPAGKAGIQEMVFEDPGDAAKEYINTLTDIFLAGLSTPVCFFCETGFQFAKVLAKRNFETSRQNVMEAADKAARYWYGDRFLPGERDDRYIQLCYRHHDPFDTVQRLESEGFVDLAVRIFKPMLLHMREVR